jgi:hypothetical protein
MILEYETYLAVELPRRLRSRLETTISGESQPLESRLRSRLVDIVRDCQAEVYQLYMDGNTTLEHEPSERQHNILASPSGRSGLSPYRAPSPITEQNLSFLTIPGPGISNSNGPTPSMMDSGYITSRPNSSDDAQSLELGQTPQSSRRDGSDDFDQSFLLHTASSNNASYSTNPNPMNFETLLRMPLDSPWMANANNDSYSVNQPGGNLWSGNEYHTGSASSDGGIGSSNVQSKSRTTKESSRKTNDGIRENRRL